MPFEENSELPIAILDILPNPVLVKDAETRYVWVNSAFEDLFNVRRADLIGQLDKDMFKDRQVAQCNGGDLRVLESGNVDEAYETVYKDNKHPRVTITRKSRLTVDGTHFLVGVMHDITDITEANRALEDSKTQLEEQSIRLAEMAYTDPLTGVLNRRRLAELAEMVFGTHRNHGGAIVCDLDHFKRVNDAYGHDAGDAALLHFVDIAQTALREGDLIARTGGEEFACLLPGTNAEESFAIAERMRAALEISPFTFGGHSIPLTVSLGATQLNGGPFQLDALLSRADKCLYRAKNEGRNRTIMAV
ncbi:MAG: GGDEF domain-containing protein [Pseudomonadota bacterium]